MSSRVGVESRRGGGKGDRGDWGAEHEQRVAYGLVIA